MIWIAIDRNGGCFVGFKVGDSSPQNFKELWGHISSTHKVEIVCSDRNSIYEVFFRNVEGVKHYATKSETCLIESYNSILRYRLARLGRRTKCYSKSLEMLACSIELLIDRLYV